MVLLLYINDRLIDSTLLSLHNLRDSSERQAYIQGAINHLLEKWEDELKQSEAQPRFVIKRL